MKTGMEWQVSSLEWSRKLEKLGVKQDSEFYWEAKVCSEINKDDTATVHLDDVRLVNARARTLGHGLGSYDRVYSAFTVAELLDGLPKIIELGKNQDEWYYLCVFCDHSINWCLAYRGINGDLYADNTDDTLENALAKAKIHLIEKGLVRV